MNLKRLAVSLLVCLTMGSFSGCAAEALPSAPTVTATLGGTFSPYHTPSPAAPTPGRSAGAPARELPSSTALPTITVTPRTYVVRAGEDLGGIASRFRVPLKDLMAANPAVTPRVMKVGTVLIIPGSAELPTAETRASASATVEPVRLETPRCLADPAGGSWCFAKVTNQSGTVLINVTVQLRLVDGTGKELARQNASLPLDLLPAGATLPLAVHFSMTLPQAAQAGAQLVSALPATAAGDHYPAVRISRQQVDLGAEGGSALASGQVELTDGKAPASQLSVLAVGYAEDGSVSAVRLWQSSQTLQAGKPLDFQVRLYALGGAIRRVELFPEARH